MLEALLIDHHIKIGSRLNLACGIEFVNPQSKSVTQLRYPQHHSHKDKSEFEYKSKAMES